MVALTDGQKRALNKVADFLPNLSPVHTGGQPKLLLGDIISELQTLETALDGVTASDDELNILDGVTASAADINVDDGASETETILVAGAVSIEKGQTLLSAASGAYAVTLAAPAALARPIRKVIRMSVAGAAITMVLTNVIGGSAATSASFDAVDECLVLLSVGTKWMVIGQAGVTLS